jgi:hypothetical protein
MTSIGLPSTISADPRRGSVARIVEVKTVVKDEEANALLSKGWELHQIDAATGGDSLWGYHLVRREATAEPAKKYVH